MKQIDVAWLAGLLEGEGCFALNQRPDRPNARSSVQVVVSMRDKDVIERAASLMGTTVRLHRTARGNHSAMWRTVASCAKAEQIMLAVRPFMGERRGERIDYILSLDLSHRKRT